MVNPKTAYRSSHALIGYKGKWPKMMTKFKSESTGKVEVRYTYGKLTAACRSLIEMNEKVAISVEIRSVEMW